MSDPGRKDFNSDIELFKSRRQATSKVMPVKPSDVSGALNMLKIQRIASKKGTTDESEGAEGVEESIEKMTIQNVAAKQMDSKNTIPRPPPMKQIVDDSDQSGETLPPTLTEPAQQSLQRPRPEVCGQYANPVPRNVADDGLSDVMAKLNPNNILRGRNDTISNIDMVLSEQHVFFQRAQLSKLTIAHTELLLEYLVKVYLNNDDAVLMYGCRLLQKLSSLNELSIPHLNLHEKLCSLQTMNVLIALSLQTGLEAYQPCLNAIETAILSRDSRTRIELFCGVVHSRLLERNSALDLAMTFRFMQLLQRVTIHIGKLHNARENETKEILNNLRKRNLPMPPPDNSSYITRNLDYVVSAAITICFEEMLIRSRPIRHPRLLLQYGPIDSLLNLLHSFVMTHGGEKGVVDRAESSGRPSQGGPHSLFQNIPVLPSRIYRILTSLCTLHPHVRQHITYHEGIIHTALSALSKVFDAYSEDPPTGLEGTREHVMNLPPTDLSLIRFLESCAEDSSFRDVLRVAFPVEAFRDAVSRLIHYIAMGQDMLTAGKTSEVQQRRPIDAGVSTALLVEATQILEAVVMLFLTVFAPNATLYIQGDDDDKVGSDHDGDNGTEDKKIEDDPGMATLVNDKDVVESIRILGQDIGDSLALLLRLKSLEIPLVQLLCRIVKRLALSFNFRQDKNLVSQLTIKSFQNPLNSDARRRSYVYALAAFSGWWDEALYDDDRATLALEAINLHGSSTPTPESRPTIPMSAYLNALARVYGPDIAGKINKGIREVMGSHDRLITGLVSDRHPNPSLDGDGNIILPSLIALTSQDIKLNEWPGFLASRPPQFRRHVHTGLLAYRMAVEDMLDGWETKESEELFRQIVVLLGVSRTSGVLSVAFMFEDITPLANMLFAIITGQKAEVVTNLSVMLTMNNTPQEDVEEDASDNAANPIKRKLKKLVVQNHTEQLRKNIGMSLVCIHLLLDLLTLHPLAIGDLRPLVQFLLGQLETVTTRGLWSRDSGMDVFAVSCMDALTSLIRIQRRALLPRRPTKEDSRGAHMPTSPELRNPDPSSNISSSLNRRRSDSQIQLLSAFNSPTLPHKKEVDLTRLTALQELVSSKLLAISEVLSVVGSSIMLRPILRLLSEISPVLGRIVTYSSMGNPTTLCEPRCTVLVRFLVMGLRSVYVAASTQAPLPSPVAYAGVEMAIKCCEIITCIGTRYPNAARAMLSRSTIEDALLELLFALTAYTSDRVNLKKAKKFSLAKHAILEPIEEEKEVDEGALDDMGDIGEEDESNTPEYLSDTPGNERGAPKKPHSETVMSSYISAVLSALTVCVQNVNISPYQVFDPYIIGQSQNRDRMGFVGRNLFKVPDDVLSIYEYGRPSRRTGIEGLVEALRRYSWPILPLIEYHGIDEHALARLQSNITVASKCLQLSAELVHNEQNILLMKLIQDAGFEAYKYSPEMVKRILGESLADADRPMHRAVMHLIGTGLLTSLQFILDVQSLGVEVKTLLESLEDTHRSPGAGRMKGHFPLSADVGVMAASCLSLIDAMIASDSKPTKTWLSTNILQASQTSAHPMNSLADLVIRMSSVCCRKSDMHTADVHRNGVALLACIVRRGENLIEVVVDKDLKGEAYATAMATATKEKSDEVSAYLMSSLAVCEHNMDLYENSAAVLGALSNISEETRNSIMSNGAFRWIHTMLKASLEELQRQIPIPPEVVQRMRAAQREKAHMVKAGGLGTGHEKVRHRSNHDYFNYMRAERTAEVAVECLRCVWALGGKVDRAEQLYAGGIFDAIHSSLEYCNVLLFTYSNSGGTLEPDTPDMAALVLRIFLESLHAIVTLAGSSPSVHSQISISASLPLISHATVFYRQMQADIKQIMEKDSVDKRSRAKGSRAGVQASVLRGASEYTELKIRLDFVAKKHDEINGCPVS